MIDFLKENMTDHHRVREARVKYRDMKMKYRQSFHKFKTKFYHLATPKPDDRQATPAATAITCYTCGQTDHITRECPKRNVDLKQIQEEMDKEGQLGQVSGNDLS